MAYFRKRESLSTCEKGDKGEDIACKFLENKGFIIVSRNFEKSWGELDIIAEKDNIIHFFEVKSVFSRYLNNSKGHKPEDNVDGFKVRQIKRMIMTYLDESGNGLDKEFIFHILSVYMDMNTRKAHVEWIKNIIL